MTTTLPTIPTREQLLYWLHEAAEIEHNLMCCYLYAAFSLKRTDPAWTPAQADAVSRWRNSVMTVAMEEMSHLCLVGNLMNALGASAHFNRPMFPIEAGPYPADFVIRLQPFSAETVAHFQFLERPHSADLADGAGFVPKRRYRRVGMAADRLSPGARDYATVGELYATLRAGLDAFAAVHGEAALFAGDPARQVDAQLAPLPGVVAVTDLARAHVALDTIVTQGEGAGEEQIESHFCRFTRIAEELAELQRKAVEFAPAWPAATNPVMNPPPTPDGKVHISHSMNARWLDIGNALYTTSLRCLVQGFGATDRVTKATWLSASFALMRALMPVGQGLAARPANETPDAPHAGLTFTSLRTLAWLPESSAARYVADRLGELRARAQALPVTPVAGESAATWQEVIDALGLQQSRLAALDGTPLPAAATAGGSVAPIAAPAPAAAATAALTEAAAPEVAKGRDVTITFHGERCIHARFCVLQAPTVFKANTPGTWLYPDRVHAESVVTVAQQCPSGAIRYTRHDGGPDESAPPVNTLHVRENGPYAVRAPIRLALADGTAVDDGFRATLCRCGRSQRKPWCDGSHAAAGFAASGEPATGNVEPLAARDGPLSITPMRNGPLRVEGNLEICAGTGRTAARVTQTRLCRCGQSKNKPFCDLSHVAAGFAADGR